MSSSIDLSGQDDVYANIRRDYESNVDSGLHEIRVISDAMPTALARIFGLLSTMSVIPLSSTSSINGDGTINLAIQLVGVTPSTIDLLQRKIYQLSETIIVRGRRLPLDQRVGQPQHCSYEGLR